LRKVVRRGIEVHGNAIIRNRNLHVDLRSMALRAKRATVFYRHPALSASVLHVIEASAQRTS
jgi:hypothetical protein